MHRSDLLANGITMPRSRVRVDPVRGRGFAAPTAPPICCRPELGAAVPAAVDCGRPAITHLVLSHHSAAAMLGLPLWGAPLERVHLIRIADGGGRRDRPGGAHWPVGAVGDRTRCRDSGHITRPDADRCCMQLIVCHHRGRRRRRAPPTPDHARGTGSGADDPSTAAVHPQDGERCDSRTAGARASANQ